MLTVSTKFYNKFPLSIEINFFMDTPRRLIYYILFLQPLSSKGCLRFRIECIDQILHLTKHCLLLCGKDVYTNYRFMRER